MAISPDFWSCAQDGDGWHSIRETAPWIRWITRHRTSIWRYPKNGVVPQMDGLEWTIQYIYIYNIIYIYIYI